MSSCWATRRGVVDIADAAAAACRCRRPTASSSRRRRRGRRAAAGLRRPTNRRRRSSRAAPSSTDGRLAEAGRRHRTRRRPHDRHRPTVGGVSERHPQRSGRERPIDTHRREHVRRLHRAARAGRRRARTHVGLVEQEQQRLALDAREAHVRRAGHLAIARARSRRRRRASRSDPSTRRSRSAASRSFSRSRSASVAASAVGERDDAGDVVGAAAPVALLAAADDQRLDRRAVRIVSTPTPFGPPNLWALNDIRSTWRRDRAEIEPAGRLHGVGVQQRPWGALGAPRSATAARSVIVPTSLLTAITLTIRDVRRERRRRADRDRRDRWRRHPTTVPPRSSTGCSTAWCSAAGHTATPAGTERSPVLSASVPHPVNTTSPGRTPSTLGDLVARFVDRPAGIAGEAMRTARVGETLGEERAASPRPPPAASASSPHDRDR